MIINIEIWNINKNVDSEISYQSFFRGCHLETQSNTGRYFQPTKQHHKIARYYLFIYLFFYYFL